MRESASSDGFVCLWVQFGNETNTKYCSGSLFGSLLLIKSNFTLHIIIFVWQSWNEYNKQPLGLNYWLSR